MMLTITRNDLGMTAEEFRQFVQKYILKVLAENKHKWFKLLDFQNYEPLTWIPTQDINFQLHQLEQKYQVECRIEQKNSYSPMLYYYKYISPQRTQRLLNKTEYKETTERYRYEMFIENNKKG